MSNEVVFHLPDLLRNWPWPRRINPFYKECKKESQEWCEGFKAFSPKAQRVFNLCDFGLFASLGYPLLDRDGCRIGCDLMNLFFIIDEHSDVADNETARRQMDCVMDALRNSHKPRPDGEWIGGEVTRSFWSNAIRTATRTAQKRFIDTFQLYTDAVVQQAVDRNAHHIRDIESYFEIRRATCGAKSSFAINGVHLSLPDTVMDDPIIKELTSLCIDMVCIGNDIYSYNVEQSRGDDGHNLVPIVMHQLGLDIHSALQWISNLHDDLVAKFLKAWNHIPVYGGPLDFEMRTYTEGLGNWVRANEQWSFESERYFGKEGMIIQETRKVVLLPKRQGVGR
ncbi:terpenoid synthase [Hymenopellis radicata]|nr:terpenoid synthase [Hymenopellis radicata]